MRFLILASFGFLITVAMLAACNSKEAVISQLPSSSPVQKNTPPPNPADNARRITAEELHKLWEKKDVLIIDTRAEPDYKASHIPGAISIPANVVAAKVDELPRDKMIVAYCT
jgi:3-mercaptopyruvate sulfurtransferase SseA